MWPPPAAAVLKLTIHPTNEPIWRHSVKTYPINLVLDNQLVILIGGGGEIARKIPGLLDVGARVRVIAPAAHQAVRRLAGEAKFVDIQL